LYGLQAKDIDLTHGFDLDRKKKDLARDVSLPLPDRDTNLDSAYFKAVK